MADLQPIQKIDYQRYYVRNPKNFSPKRNKAIVEQTIREAEAVRDQKAKQYDEHYAERADAVITYLRSLDNGKGSTNIEKYFGKRELARLRGIEIRDKLMAGMTLKNKLGQVIKSAKT